MKALPVTIVLLAILGSSRADDPPAKPPEVASPLAVSPGPCDKLTDEQLNQWIETLRKERTEYMGLSKQFSEDAKLLVLGLGTISTKLTDRKFRTFASTLFSEEIDWNAPTKPQLLALDLIAVRLLTDVQDSLDEAEFERIQRLCPPRKPIKDKFPFSLRLEPTKDRKDMDEKQLKAWSDYTNVKFIDYCELSLAYSGASLALSKLENVPSPTRPFSLKPNNKIRDFLKAELKRPFDTEKQSANEYVGVSTVFIAISMSFMGESATASEEASFRNGLLKRDKDQPVK